MASTGKGKRKVKGKTLDLNSFLGDQNAPTGYAVVAPRMDWADSVEEEEKYSYVKEEKLILPTAPKAARGPDVDMSKIPSQAPFTAFVGNLPYDIAEEDITRFFGNLKVLSVRLPRDGGDRGRMRGFGYAEFEDKQSLIEALGLNGETLKNRPIKVSLAGEHENDKDRKNDGPDRTAGDWRAGPREDSFSSRNDRQRNGTFGSKYDDDRDSYKSKNGYDNDREPYRGRSSYDDNRYRDDDRDRPSYQGRKSYERERGDRDYGFGRDRDRYSRDGENFSDRDRDRGGGYNRRYGDRGFDSYDRDNRDSDRGSNRRYGGGGGGYEDRNRGYGGRGRRDDDPDSRRDEDKEKDVPKERPRLQLKPRTVPVEQTAAPVPAPAAGSSIFGGAKPVNTAAREREIEMRLAKEKEKLAEPERPKFNQSSRYGDRIPSSDRDSSYKRDRDQKYDTRDSREESRRDQYSPKRRYNDEPLKEKNSSDYKGQADLSDRKSYDNEPRYQNDQECPRESRSRNVKGGSNQLEPEQENDEPVKFLSNKFAHLLEHGGDSD